MRVGLILSAVPGYSETFFKNWVTGLKTRGFEPILFIDQSTSVRKYHGAVVLSRERFLIFSVFKILTNFMVSFIYLKKNINNSGSLKESIKRVILDLHILSAKQMDWIHFGFGTVGLQREAIGSTIGAKSAVSFRGFDIGIYPLKHPNCYNTLLQKINKIHVISDDIANLVIAESNFKQNKITKITPAIDTNLFSNSDKRNWNELNFISVGRLHWKKGFNYVIEALAELNLKGVDFKYTIVGSGSEYERIAYLAHKFRILDKIFFINKVDSKEVANYLKNNNYFIQYSIQEGFGNAVLEAQSSGLITIVSDAEGLSENVLHNKTGFVVPKLQPKLFFEQILQLKKMSHEELEKMSIFASQRVKENFTLEKQIDEFVEFYTS